MPLETHEEPEIVAAEEDTYRSHILNSSLPLSRARRIIDGFDWSKPFYSRLEFVEALAALSALHSDEMDKMIPGPNRRVKEVLWSAAAPGRAEWYFNNIRLRARVHPSRHTLLPYGTASHESLHAEINNWYPTSKINFEITVL